jgi:hypothetical protein
MPIRCVVEVLHEVWRYSDGTLVMDNVPAVALDGFYAHWRHKVVPPPIGFELDLSNRGSLWLVPEHTETRLIAASNKVP